MIEIDLTPLQALTLQAILEAFIKEEKKAAIKDLGVMDSSRALRVETCDEVCEQISDHIDIIEASDLNKAMADYNADYRNRANKN